MSESVAALLMAIGIDFLFDDSGKIEKAQYLKRGLTPRSTSDLIDFHSQKIIRSDTSWRKWWEKTFSPVELHIVPMCIFIIPSYCASGFLIAPYK
jgi:hypothetical protein